MSNLKTDLVLRLVRGDDRTAAVSACFGYDPDNPFAVSAVFRTAEGDVTWTFARELLDIGTFCRVGDGDIRIWPSVHDGTATVNLFLSSPAGTALLEADQADVRLFLEAAYDLVPAGTESVSDDLDAVLAQLLGPGTTAR